MINRVRIRTAWCALRGGHWMRLKSKTTSDIILECGGHPAACGYTAMIVLRSPVRPLGKQYHGSFTDETPRCPDCGNPPETHSLYKDGKCPVIRITSLTEVP